MKRGQSWFEKLIYVLIAVTGTYILYRGTGILVETGALRNILSSGQAAEVLQEVSTEWYLPGFASVLRSQDSPDIWERLIDEVLPVLRSWRAQIREVERLEQGEETGHTQGGTEGDTGQIQGGTEGDTEQIQGETEEGIGRTQSGTEGDILQNRGGAKAEISPALEESRRETEDTAEVDTEGASEEGTAVTAMGSGYAQIPGELRNYSYLLNHYFVVDRDTFADEVLLDAEKLLEKDLTLKKREDPQILIYHTHSQEAFLDSVEGDPETGIVGVGAYLAQLLEEYGYGVIHDTGVYDLVDGVLDRNAAYDYARTAVEKILEEHPSIEVVIDLHRDGVEGHHFVIEEEERPTAQIMFFNGLCRDSDGNDIEYLSNPYIEDNLAFSFQLQLAAEKEYPGFTRNIYLKGQRFNLHFRPRSLLIEAGSQLNTLEEEKNAMEPLADILNQVLSGAVRGETQ